MKTLLRCLAVGLALLCLGVPARADVILAINGEITADGFTGTFLIDVPSDPVIGNNVTVAPNFLHFGADETASFVAFVGSGPNVTFGSSAAGDSLDMDITFFAFNTSLGAGMPTHADGFFTSAVDAPTQIPWEINATFDSLTNRLSGNFTIGAVAPVPEPSSYALLGFAGLIGGAAYYRRRKAVAA